MRSATSKTSARLWLITTTPRPRSRSALDQVEHLLRSARRRAPRSARRAARPSGRPAASARSRPTGAGRPRASPTSARTLGIVTASDWSSSRELVLHRDLVEQPRDPAAPVRRPRGRGRGWRRRRGCRTARGPGRRSRCPSAVASCGLRDASPARRRTKNSPSSAELDAGDGLDQGRLAGAVVADERRRPRRRRPRSRRRSSACTAPKRLLTPSQLAGEARAWAVAGGAARLRRAARHVLLDAGGLAGRRVRRGADLAAPSRSRP